MRTKAACRCALKYTLHQLSPAITVYTYFEDSGPFCGHAPRYTASAQGRAVPSLHCRPPLVPACQRPLPTRVDTAMNRKQPSSQYPHVHNAQTHTNTHNVLGCGRATRPAARRPWTRSPTTNVNTTKYNTATTTVNTHPQCKFCHAVAKTRRANAANPRAPLLAIQMHFRMG